MAATFTILSCDTHDRVRWQAFYDRLPLVLRAIHFSPAYAAAQGHEGYCAVAQHGDEFIMQPFVIVPDATMENVYGYGGPIGHERLADDLEQGMAAWRKDSKIICERIVLHPRLARFQAPLLPNRLCAPYVKDVVVVQTEPSEFYKGVTAKRRAAIEKATRDKITTSRSTSIGQPLTEFSTLYTATMERTGAAPRWQKQREFFTRHMTELKGHVCLISAHQKGKTVSAAMVLVEPPEAYYQYAGNSGVSGASDLLIVEAVKLAHECGCPTLDLGGGVTATPDDPVFWYKSTFSDHRRPVHVLNRVHDQEAFDKASAGFEGVGYFPPWRAGAQVRSAAQGTS